MQPYRPPIDSRKNTGKSSAGDYRLAGRLGKDKKSEVSLALFLADKVGTDSHVVANLLMETRSVDCSGSAMRWLLDFTVQPANEQEAELFSACVRPRSSGTGNRWSVPKEMRDLYRNN